MIVISDVKLDHLVNVIPAGFLFRCKVIIFPFLYSLKASHQVQLALKGRGELNSAP